MKRILLALSVSAAMVSPALAADLPMQSAPPYYPAPPLFTWTGFYLGANGAFGFGRFSNGGNSFFGNADGGLFGVTAGYNYQSGPFVAGVEGDINFGSVSGNSSPFGGVSANGNVTSEGSLRARVGYAIDRALLYITGGYTGANLKGTVTDFASNPSIFASQSVFLNGWVLGAGMEFAITRNVSVKAEYLFSDYGNASIFNNTPDNISAGLKLSTIRAGINYHF